MKTLNALGAVLVTGTSSGIGHVTALRLARAGFLVFAGVRRERDADELVREGGQRLLPVLIDVTETESINGAVGAVAAGLRGLLLRGLVNNAGIGISGPVETISLEEVHRQYDVNVIGQIAVTQAFLPLLRQGSGRVINICSVGDRITIPFGGVLCGCKRALAATSEALRLELHPWGLDVCMIEPGSIRTPAIDKTLGDVDGRVAAMSPLAASRYGEMLRRFTQRAVKQEANGSAPEVVAETILEALTAARPKTRYLTGKDAHLLAFLGRWIPDRMLDRLRLRMFGLPTRFGGLVGVEPVQSGGD